VYVFDLLGYGNSPPPPNADLSLRGHARRLAELLDSWDIEDAAVVGHDIGGAVALRTHLLERRRFRQIALIDAVVLAPWMTPTTRHMQAHLDVYRSMPVEIFDQIVAAHLRSTVARGMDTETLAAYLQPWEGEKGQTAYLEKIAQFDEEETREFEHLLGSIDVPVLVIWGECDAWLDASLVDRLARIIPHAKIRTLPDVGHFAMEDAPEAVASALNNFLTSTR
jgi:pimeloyl-ACP methyl ester carboxylesterase